MVITDTLCLCSVFHSSLRIQLEELRHISLVFENVPLHKNGLRQSHYAHHVRLPDVHALGPQGLDGAAPRRHPLVEAQRQQQGVPDDAPGPAPDGGPQELHLAPQQRLGGEHEARRAPEHAGELLVRAPEGVRHGRLLGPEGAVADVVEGEEAPRVHPGARRHPAARLLHAADQRPELVRRLHDERRPQPDGGREAALRQAEAAERGEVPQEQVDRVLEQPRLGQPFHQQGGGPEEVEPEEDPREQVGVDAVGERRREEREEPRGVGAA